MSRWRSGEALKRWLHDTLFKRLFLLMWAALIVSHLCAFFVVRYYMAMDGDAGFGMPQVLSALPPGGLLPDQAQHAPMGPPPGGERGDPHGREGPGGPPPGEAGWRGGMLPEPPPGAASGMRARRGLPADALWLDYGVRFLVIGLAAWLGARWLSRPMKKLASASNALGDALSRRQPAPKLDEHGGTLEVRQTAQVFNTMATRLHAQFDAQGLLMAAISHDLRTPLSRLRMRLEQMQGHPQAERGVADVREMDALIGSVLEMLRGNDDTVPRQRVDVLALVQSLADDLGEQGQPVSVAPDDVAAPAPVLVLAQPAALGRALGNLIGNALRYGSAAQVRVFAQAGRAHVQIDDRGPGIPEHQLDAVFQPFYRIETSRSRSTAGTGLGLYIARDLAQRIGGQIVLANRPEGGLRAELVMPLA